MIGSSADMRAQLATQLEAAFGLVAQADVDHGEIGQPRAKRFDRFLARAVRAHRIAVTLKCRGVVVADRGFVFDDGDDFLHGSRSRLALRGAQCSAAARAPDGHATIDHNLPAAGTAGARG